MFAVFLATCLFLSGSTVSSDGPEGKAELLLRRINKDILEHAAELMHAHDVPRALTLDVFLLLDAFWRGQKNVFFSDVRVSMVQKTVSLCCWTCFGCPKLFFTCGPKKSRFSHLWTGVGELQKT